MTPAVWTPRGFRPVIQPRRGRVLPFRRRGLGDTPQTFQQALAATGWKPGQPIPFIPTPPGGWPDINPATGAVIPNSPAAPVIVTAASGGTAGDQMGQAATPTPVAPATVAPPAAAPVVAVQPAGAPAPVDVAVSTSTSFFSKTVLGIPIWMLGAGALAYFVFSQQGGHHGR